MDELIMRLRGLQIINYKIFSPFEFGKLLSDYENKKNFQKYFYGNN